MIEWFKVKSHQVKTVTERRCSLQEWPVAVGRRSHQASACAWSAASRQCHTAGPGRCLCKREDDTSAVAASSTSSGWCQPHTAHLCTSHLYMHNNKKWSSVVIRLSSVRFSARPLDWTKKSGGHGGHVWRSADWLIDWSFNITCIKRTCRQLTYDNIHIQCDNKT